MRKSTPNSDLSHESFTAGENQEILLQKQNCIQEARTWDIKPKNFTKVCIYKLFEMN